MRMADSIVSISFAEEIRVGNKAYQVMSSGAIVWVNSLNNLGRFTRNLAEINFPGKPQHTIRAAVGESLTVTDWELFKAGIKTGWGIEIDGKHMPRYLQTELVS